MASLSSRVISSWLAPGAVGGDHQPAPEARRQRRDRRLEDREVVGGGGPGRPGPQHPGHRLAPSQVRPTPCLGFGCHRTPVQRFDARPFQRPRHDPTRGCTPRSGSLRDRSALPAAWSQPGRGEHVASRPTGLLALLSAAASSSWRILTLFGSSMLNGTKGCAHSHKASVSLGGQRPARSRRRARSTHANAVSTWVPQPSAGEKGLHSADDGEYAIQPAGNGKHVSTPRSLPPGEFAFPIHKMLSIPWRGCVRRTGPSKISRSSARSDGGKR